MQIGNYNLVMLTATKIPDVLYFQNHLGYDIVYSQLVGTAVRGAQGRGGPGHEGVLEVWIFESTRFHGTKMVI